MFFCTALKLHADLVFILNKLEGVVHVADIRFNQAGFQLEQKECDNPKMMYGAMYIDEVINVIGTNSSTGFV